MSYNLRATHQYEKDVKRAKKRGLNIDKLIDVISMLVNEQTLPVNNHDHALSGNYSGYRECHIEPDWLLIYEKCDEIRLITLVRTVTHSDLF